MEGCEGKSGLFGFFPFFLFQEWLPENCMVEEQAAAQTAKIPPKNPNHIARGARKGPLVVQRV